MFLASANTLRTSMRRSGSRLLFSTEANDGGYAAVRSVTRLLDTQKKSRLGRRTRVSLLCPSVHGHR